MDGGQEQMQNFTIFKESFNIINSSKKLFSQITLLFIFPLALIFLGLMPNSNLLFDNAMYNEYRREAWIKFWLFEAAYFTLLLIFFLLSTAAVVYTVACIYTAQTVHFKKVRKVIPKVWKTLIVTLLCMFFAFFLYIIIIHIIFVLTIWWEDTIWSTTFGFVMFWIILLLYTIGLIYMTIIWQISTVVAVLEGHYGLKALLKARDLIKGKKLMAVGGEISILNGVFTCTVFIYFIFVVCEQLEIEWLRILLGVLCLLIMPGVFLYGFVVQTVVYLVCKSNHHEIIDKLKLWDQLDGYIKEQEPVLKVNKDFELGQAQSSQQ